MHARVFVFGTLRVESHRWARDAEDGEPIINCTARGTMYDNIGFPYVNFDGPGIVYGDILTFDANHPSYLRMCAVEQGAGYVERQVEVVTPARELLVVTAWDASAFTRTERLPRLEVVTSGDWLVAESQRRMAYFR